jgi:hypothetical protein
MYAFVDQPVADLSPAGRFLLWSMRGWIHAASRGNCPPGQLAPGFARIGALPALPHLHRLLAELNHRARGEIAFAPLDYHRVSDDEAVLLQLWRDATLSPPRAQETLALLLDADSVAPAFEALLAASIRLDETGVGPIDLISTAEPSRD